VNAIPAPTLGRTTFRTGGLPAFCSRNPEEPWDAAIARLAEDVLPCAGSDHGLSRAPPG
jgi:hypothetical protein